MSAPFLNDAANPVLDLSPDSIVRVDREGRFTLVNRKAEEFMQRGREDILGRTNEELGMPASVCRQFNEDLHSILSSKASLNRTFSFEGKFFEAKCIPELEADGTVASIYIYTRNIDALVEQKEVLASQLKYAQDLIKAIQEPILVLNTQLEVQSSNAVFRERFVMEEDELVGRPLKAVAQVWRTNVRDLQAKLEKLIDETVESPVELEAEVDIPEEGLRLMLCHASRIDHMPLILLSMRDITEYRHHVSNLESDLKRQNRELSDSYSKLKAVLVELSETEDRERNKLAELLHDDLQQLLVSLGFQLKVLGEETPDKEHISRLLAQAESLVQRSVRMTRDLSKELSPIGPRNATIRETLHDLADQMRDLHGLEVDISIKGNVRTSDTTIRALLVKAVKEMLLNIVKHADVREASLEAGEENGILYVWVRDHGKGFNPDDVLRKRGGLGLGLFSIKERLQALGGRLEVDSAKGRGSRFRLEIPLQDSDGEKVHEQTEVEKVVLEGEDGVVGVVLVDDHVAMRQALAGYLDRHPRLQVVGQASDGREGVNVVQAERPDVVLMDLAMPRLSGAEATREIKSRFPKIRVVGLSLFPDEGLSESLREVGMDAFVQKTALLSEVFDELIPEE